MSTPPAPATPPSPKDSEDKPSPGDDKPSPGDKEKLPPETESAPSSAPSSEEEPSDAVDKAVAESDTKPDAADEAVAEGNTEPEGDDKKPAAEEKKPRRGRGKRKDRRKRKKDNKESPSEDPDEEKDDDEKDDDEKPDDEGKEKKPREKKPAKPKEPEKPKSYGKAGSEVQAYMDQLQDEEGKLAKRNKYLLGALAGVGFLLLLTFLGIYCLTNRSYAVLDNIEIKQNPVDPGRLEFKFDVVKPGKVRYCRNCGGIEKERIDTYDSAGSVECSWPAGYLPGKSIHVSLWHRGWLSPKKFTGAKPFPTNARVDVVVLMDTTRSMNACISDFGRQGFLAFVNRLKNRGVKARYALVGFGGPGETGLDCALTKDVMRFHGAINGVRRFNGDGLSNSALDALEESLSLNLEKGSTRCFYLVTDTPYREATRSGKTAEQIAEELKKHGVLLRVFSRPELENNYAKLLGQTGRFMPIQSFGQVIREGRILGD